MASTWSSLKIQLMGAGDEGGTWGTVTNANLGTVIEEAITGSSNVTFASADVTLTLTDTTASQTARNLRLNLTGTTGGARNLIVPAIEKVYIVNNGCADAVTVKNSTGSGIAVPAGKTMYVFNNGTDVVDAITHLSSLTLASPLAIAAGGTGSATATFSGANISNLNAANVSTGVLAIANGGTGSSTATFSGANITSLNASNISSGTIANSNTTAASANGASTIVARDASGNFSANTITSNLTGTASNATVLQTARTIAIQDGVTGTATSFNGSTNISIPVTGINVSVANAGTLAVARGGTGANDASGARSNLGLGSLATLSSVGTSQIDNSAVTPGKLSQPFTTGTASATTSGTSVDITGIPSWARKITVILNAVSTSGSSNVLIQIGDSGGIENTGYATATTWCVFNTNLQSTAGSITSGWAVALQNDASYLISGILTLCNVSGDTWIGSGSCNQQTVAMNTFAGSKTLSATLDRIRITTANGTDTFDAGSINIMYQ